MKKLNLAIISILVILAFVAMAKHRDIVYTIEGNEHVGELVKIDDNEVILRTKEGEIAFPADSVRSVDLGQWRPGDDWENRLDIDDPLLEGALEKADEVSREYTNAGYITLYEKGTLTINADKSATFVQRYIYYIANERGKNKANWSTTYFDDIQDVTVDFARAIGFSRVSTVADNAIEDASTSAWIAEYQRQRKKKFAMTGASLGSIIDYQITKTYRKTDIFNGLDVGWQFYDTEPIVESIFEVRYEDDLDIYEFKMPEPKKSKDGDYKIRTYRMTDIEPFS